jgi:hypothetical protein
MASFSDKQLKEYQAYLTDFDPSPQNYGDDYSAPLELDDWLDEQENEEFAGLVTSFMMNEEITSAQAEKRAHDQMDAQRDVANRFTTFMQTTTNS